ncbi:MAG: PLP-dependent transferase [Alistipes shahii]|uniref:PLP-dependent transferase n=1 Tax=Alistipes shahii TaxID=328814 RepID=UPI00399D56AD
MPRRPTGSKVCDRARPALRPERGGQHLHRLQNPTTTAYEQRIAALYGAVGALAVSSGMSAILVTVLSLASEGDNIVASPFLYGGTYNQFRITLRQTRHRLPHRFERTS